MELAGFLGSATLWIKAAHVIFVIFFMAGLFMMPRFFVYHHQCAVGSEEDAKWIEREARLRKIILAPAIMLVWLFGLLLAFNADLWGEAWFLAKFASVIALSGYHGWMIGYAKKLAKGQRPLTEKQLRIINEVPGIAAAIIVILVIVKPFQGIV